MGFKSDIEIAQEATPQDIREIAKKLNLTEDDLDLYGKYKAKVDYNLLKKETGKKARLILTTAINPTPAGEGKTTTTIGVADGLSKLGKNTLVALREPSLGPVFGSRAGLLAAVMHRSCQWKISTCISPAISMLLEQPTICWPRCLIIISNRAMN